MVVSVIFSSIVYEISTGEIRRGLDTVSEFRPARTQFSEDIQTQRDMQAAKIRKNIIVGLIYSNLGIILAGAIAGYWLARKTLAPIKEMHEAQSRFVSDASHELRTPLTGMKAEIEVYLRDKNITKSELRELAKSNLEEVDRLANLSEVLLQLSQLGEKEHLEKQLLPLDEVLVNATEPLERIHRIVEISTPKTPLLLRANEATFIELLRILLDNAQKYSDKSEPIKVSYAVKNGQVCIKISNPAERISSKDLSRIFERFYRGDKSRNSTGYGLGLALAQRIAQLHKGDITLKNQQIEGKNNVVATVILPECSKIENE